MAFRSSAIASSPTGGTLTATPAGVVANDYLGALCIRDVAGVPPSYPVGWAEQVNNDLSGPDGQTARYADKATASGSDSFAFIFSSASALITAAWSGRNNASAFSTTPTTTTDITGNAFNISATLSGITAASNDDVAVWMFTDQDNNTSRASFSQLTSYTQRQNAPNLDWVSGIALDTRDAVSAGATGSFTTTITDTTAQGFGGAGYGAIVVALALAGADTLMGQACL